jgi:hypothetical protein
MIARELETGTHLLAWNQSVTRTRWLATKLAIVGGAVAATVGLLSWAVTSWAHRIDDASGDRITPMLFGARGIVPVGFALFAFVLGVTAGMLIRRTVPAMAATLAIYIAAVYSMAEWIRAHLRPASHDTNPLDISSLDGLMISTGNEMTLVGSDSLAGAWVLSNQSITPAGEVFSGPADTQTCGIDASAHACEEWLGTLGCAKNSPTTPPTPRRHVRHGCGSAGNQAWAVLECRERGIGRDQFEVERLPLDLVDNHEHASSDNLRVRVVVIERNEESVTEGDDALDDTGCLQRLREVVRPTFTRDPGRAQRLLPRAPLAHDLVHGG